MVTKFLLLITISIAVFLPLFGQADTTWFDDKFKPTEKLQSTYFQLSDQRIFRGGSPINGTYTFHPSMPTNLTQIDFPMLYYQSNRNVICHVNFKNGLMDGEVSCKQKYYPTEDSLYAYFNLSPKPDSFFIRGQYDQNSPVEGNFFTNRSIITYQEGKPNGYELVFYSDLLNSPAALLHYENGILDGEQRYFLRGVEYKADYKKGKLINGIQVNIDQERTYDESTAWEISRYFAFFKKGKPTVDTLFVHRALGHLLRKNGKPFQGWIRPENNFNFVYNYKQFQLTNIFTTSFSDTLENLTIDGLTGNLYDRSGTLKARIDFSVPYTSGTVNYMNDGEVVSLLKFKNDTILYGMIPECTLLSHSKDNFKIKLIKDNAGSTLEVISPDLGLKKVVHYPPEFPIQWPFALEDDSLVKPRSLQERTEELYDIETGKLLATYKVENGIQKGIMIRQMNNFFYVTRFPEDPDEIHYLGYSQLIKKLAEWYAE